MRRVPLYLWVISRERGIKHDDEDETITEWTWIHEIPEYVVFVEATSWTWNDRLEYATNHICEQLEEEGGDIDDLRSELL